MSERNVETIRTASVAWSEDGLASEAALSYLDAGVVFEEPPEQPAPRMARGRDAVIEMLKKFDEAWEEHSSELEEARAIDGERVLVFSIEHFRGRDGIKLDQPGASILTLRDDKIVRIQAFWDRATALEAAGVPA